MEIKYRQASLADLEGIKKFVDFWLSGRGKRKGVVGSSDDYFVSPGQHKSALKYNIVWLALEGERIIGWGVKGKNGVLKHLLVAGDHRHRGVGEKLLRILDPDIVRSKYDQGTGDPIGFYEKMGYVKVQAEREGKKHNIDVLIRGEALRILR